MFNKIGKINSPTGSCNTGYAIQFTFTYDNNVYYYAGLEVRFDVTKHAVSKNINVAALYQSKEIARNFANEIVARLIKNENCTLGGESFYGKQDELSYEIVKVMEIIKREVKIVKAQHIPHASEREGNA